MVASTINWAMTRGVVVGNHRINLLTFPLGMAGQGAEVPTQLVGWSPNGAQSLLFELEAKTLCFVPRPNPHLLVVSPFGKVKVIGPGGVSDAPLVMANGPLERGPLLDARFVGKHAYVAGMHRQLYRREISDSGTADWVRCDGGLVLPSPSAEVVGLCSVDGFDEDEMYAVGWQGEVWTGRPGSWQSVPPLTNLKLERVLCAPDGRVYAVGQAGLLLKGRGMSWSVLPNEVTTDGFWGCTWYRDRLWLCTRKRLYVLDKDDQLTDVSASLPDGADTGWLDADETTLWSIGPRSLSYTDDGKTWQQVILEAGSAGP